MSLSWSRMLSRLFRKPATRPVVRRSSRLNVEQVEDRVVPATIITIQEAAGTLDGFLSATDGTILTTDNAGVTGSISRAALEGVNPNVSISITAESSIVVANLTAGPLALQTDATHFASFIASTGTLNFNDQLDSITTAGAALFLSAVTSISLGGLDSNGGDIDISADDIDLQAPINAGAGSVTLNSTTGGIGIDLGTNTAGKLSLTQAELNNVISTGVLRIGDTSSGTFVVSAPINANAPIVRAALVLISGAAMTDTGTGSITSTNLRLSGTGPITLDNGAANAVNNLVANMAGSPSSGAVFFANGIPLTVSAANIDGIAGFTTINGNVTLVADVLDVAGNVNVGNMATGGIVTFQPLGATIDIDVGTETGGKLSLTDAELDRVTARVLRIGVLAGSIDIDVSAAITLGANVPTLSLIANDTITDTGAGSLAVTNLRATGTDGVTLDALTNEVSTLAGVTNNAGAAANFVYTDATGFAVDTVDGVAGISTDLTVAGTRITLTAGGAVTQTAGGDLSTRNVELLGTGSYTLTNVGNGTIFIAANTTGAVSYTDKDALTISIVNATTGVTTVNSAIAINTVNGPLVVQDTNAGADVNAGLGTVILNAGSSGNDNALTLDANAGVTGTGGVTLQADGMSIGAAVNAGANTARLDTHELTTAINLGGADGVATLGLTDTELDFVTAGVIIVGNTNNDPASNITVSAAIDTANTSQLELVTGGSILNGGGSITETRLGMTATALIGASANPLDISVSNLEAVTNTNGIFIDNTGTALTVGGVNGTLDGVRTLVSSPITITNDNSITVDAGISVGGLTGGVTITANGSGGTGVANIAVNAPVSVDGLFDGGITITNIDNDDEVTITINASLSVTGSNGNITVNAEDHITVSAAVSAVGNGNIDLIADFPGGGTGDFTSFAGGTVTNEAGDITITGIFVTFQDTVSSIGGGGITVLATQDVNVFSNVTASGGNGNILIQANAESDLNATISAAGTGTITYDTDLDGSGVGELQINSGGGLVTEGGDITFRGQDLDIISGQINAGTGEVFILTRDLADVIELGTSDPAGSLGLTDFDLDQITAAVLNIGSTATNTGGIAITAQISLAPGLVPTLSLETGGAITDPVVFGVPDITVDNLALRAATGIGSADDIDVSVSNLAATNTTTGNILIQNFGDLTLARAIDGLDGITNNATGNIDITTDGSLFIDSLVSATGGGNIDLTAGVDLTLVAGTGGVVASGGNGNITLNAAGNITINSGVGPTEIFAAGTGDVTLYAGGGVLVAGGVIIQSGNNNPASGGNITIRSNVGNDDGTADIDLSGAVPFGVNINTLADIVLDADPDGNCIGGTLLTSAATQLHSTIGGVGAGNITIHVATDIILRNALAVGNISVHSCQNIFDDGDDATIYSAGGSISLDAFGIIGGATPITTADILSASTAAPTANYRAALDVAYGTTITVDQTGSLGNIQIRKVGAALNTSTVLGVNGLPDIVGGGNQLVLIGAAGLNVNNVFTLSGAVNANLFLASVNGFDVAMVGAGSAINNGASTTTTVIASGSTTASITGPAANNTANVTGFNVLLATSGGNIGAVGSPIEINSDANGRFDGFTNGTVNGVANAGGDAFITDTQNGIRVGLFNAGTAGDVTLASLGNITPTGSSIVAVTHNDNVAEIVGDIVSLNASATSTGTGGQIGLPATFFEVNSNMLSASTNNSNFWIAEVGTGGTAGTSIGLMTVGTTTGTTTGFLRVRNGGTITSAAVNGVADVIAPTVNLSNVAGDTPTGGGFGTSTASPLEINASTLNSNLPNGGNEFVRDTAGGLTVQRANTTVGSVGIETVGGNLVLGNASSTGSVVLATNGTATLTATGSITSEAPNFVGVMDVTANALAAFANGGGVGSLPGVALETTVGTIAGTAAAGQFGVINTGNLIIGTVGASVGVTATNDDVLIITLGSITVNQATQGATSVFLTAVDALAAGQNLTVNAQVNSAGDINLRAGDDLTVNAGPFINAFGNVTLTGDFGNADPGVGSTIDVFGAVESGTPAAVNGGPDNDSIFIAVGESDNAFSVNGNAPVFPTFPGDSLTLDLTGVTAPVITPTGTGAGIYSFGNRPDVVFTSIENLIPGQIISGTVFLDVNRNGVQDLGDQPLAGITVHLDRGDNGTDDEVTITDVNGEYFFPDQTPGTYSIRFDSNPQFVNTTPNPVVIGPLDATTGIDFGTFGRSIEAVGGPNSGTVIVRDTATGATIRTIVAYPDPAPGFIGTVHTAVGDVNGDGYLDAITGAGPGGGPHVKVFSGRDFTLIADFFAYADSFRGGVFVAAGDLNGDGRAEIITGAGQSGGPHVKVFVAGTFLGAASVEVASFFAYDPSVLSGVNVGAGDVNGDGLADVITGARGGAGFAPHVKVFNGAGFAVIRSFFAYASTFTGGVFVAGGDLNGDGFADIITGSETQASHVKAFSGQTGAELQSFFAYDSSIAGVSVGTADYDNDGDFDILTGSRIGSHVKVFDGITLATLDSYLAFATDLNGVFVGGA